MSEKSAEDIIKILLENQTTTTEKMDSMFFGFTKLVSEIHESEKRKQEHEIMLKNKEIKKMTIMYIFGFFVALTSLTNIVFNKLFFDEMKQGVRSERGNLIGISGQLVTQMQVAEKNNLFRERLLLKHGDLHFVDSVENLQFLKIQENPHFEEVFPKLDKKYNISRYPWIIDFKTDR